MQFTNIVLSAISLLTVASAAPTDLALRQVPTKACSHTTGGVHVIAVPGEGFTNPPYGLIGSLASTILQRIPGSSNVSVPYNHSDPNGLHQTQLATTTTLHYIAQYHQACPNTKIVLLGYSSGAIDVMNVMCGEPKSYQPPTAALSYPKWSPYVIAAVAYGDETRAPGTSFDLGTCKGAGLHPRPNSTSTCAPWAGRIQSYCDKEDPECCTTTGTDKAAHYVYPQEYDNAAANFVVSQFKKLGGA